MNKRKQLALKKHRQKQRKEKERNKKEMSESVGDSNHSGRPKKRLFGNVT